MKDIFMFCDDSYDCNCEDFCCQECKRDKPDEVEDDKLEEIINKLYGVTVFKSSLNEIQISILSGVADYADYLVNENIIEDYADYIILKNYINLKNGKILRELDQKVHFIEKMEEKLTGKELAEDNMKRAENWLKEDIKLFEAIHGVDFINIVKGAFGIEKYQDDYYRFTKWRV